MEGSMSKKQLAQMYGISRQTFRTWLIRASIIPEVIKADEFDKIRIFTPAQVKAIKDKIGEP